MVNAAALAALPAGAFVINTARGGLIDEAALVAALDSGHIGGAALDVFEGEPPEAGPPLRDHPLAIVTPHVSGTTPRSLVAMGVMAAECIAAVLTGAPVPEGRIVPPPTPQHDRARAGPGRRRCVAGGPTLAAAGLGALSAAALPPVHAIPVLLVCVPGLLALIDGAPGLGRGAAARLRVRARATTSWGCIGSPRRS